MPIAPSGGLTPVGFRVDRVKVAPQISLEVATGGATDAPVVAFLHGGGQTRHAWKSAGAEMAKAGYRVLLFDARGHGGSDWSPHGDYSATALTGDLVHLMAAERQPLALVGASMGGMTSFLVAGRHPERVAALVLVDIVPTVNPQGAVRIHRFMTEHGCGFASLEEAADAIAAYNPARARSGNLSGLMRYLRRREDGRLYWHWDPRLMGTQRVEPPTFVSEARAMGPAITAPTLLIRGMLSDMIDEAGIQDLRTLVPQTEILEVEGAGHMVAGDRNDAFNDGVLRFLRRHFPVTGGSAGSGPPLAKPIIQGDVA